MEKTINRMMKSKRKTATRLVCGPDNMGRDEGTCCTSSFIVLNANRNNKNDDERLRLNSN